MAPSTRDPTATLAVHWRERENSNLDTLDALVHLLELILVIDAGLDLGAKRLQI
jgi:hypothetical protein